MRGLVIEQGALRFSADLPGPAAKTGESRVRISQAGICATDLALARGYMGFSGIPGHEFVGVALDGPMQGRRVVGEINAACGSCEYCQRDLGRHCPNRSVLGILGRHGCFAEEITLPHENLLEVPDEVTDDDAVFVEPLAAAYEIAEQLDLSTFRTAVVVGDGRLGLLCAAVLAQAGLEVSVIGRHPERAELLGPSLRYREWEDAPRFDLAVEATGHPEVLQRVMPLVKPRGTLVLKTTSEAPASLDLAPLVIDEITVVGSRCGLFAPALDALARGDFAVDNLIEGRYPLEEGVEAVRHAGQPGVLKILLELE